MHFPIKIERVFRSKKEWKSKRSIIIGRRSLTRCDVTGFSRRLSPFFPSLRVLASTHYITYSEKLLQRLNPSVRPSVCLGQLSQKQLLGLQAREIYQINRLVELHKYSKIQTRIFYRTREIELFRFI